MANRYRVGATGDWADGVNGWSLTSGGAAGQADPTAADDVFFDGNSGTGTVTVAASAACRSFNGTGYGGTIAGTSQISFGDATIGNITLGSGMTWSQSGNFRLSSSTGVNTITTNGVSIAGRILFQFAVDTGSWRMDDALTTTNGSPIQFNTNSTFNTNGFTLTANGVTTANSPTITLGASSIVLNGTGTLWDIASGATLNSNTSAISITDTSSTGKTVALGGKTYNNMSVTAGGTGLVNFSGATNNTFNTLTLAGPKSVRFAASQTQTFTSFVADGTAGNLVTIDSSLAGTAATLSDAGGTNAVTYVSLQDSTATGGASWTAEFSTNVSGNTGWTFLVVAGGSTTTSTAMLVGVG